MRCRNKGPTITIIETTAGDIVGGYTNTSWDHGSRCAVANKAFLFALSGFGISSPLKMELKDKCNNRAIDNRFGPAFGGRDGEYRRHTYIDEKPHDLKVSGSSLVLNTGVAYERGMDTMVDKKAYEIKRIEVYSVDSGGTIHLDPRKRKQLPNAAKDPPKVDRFTKEVNDAINEKWKSLNMLEAQISSFEESFEDEQTFIEIYKRATAEKFGFLYITMGSDPKFFSSYRSEFRLASDATTRTTE